MLDTRELKLGALLRKWQEGVHSGEPLDVEELCREHPDLSDELLQRIHGGSTPIEQDVDRTVRDAGRDTPWPRSYEPLPQIDGYEILDVLGQGGMGIVYKARQVRADRIVALKRIRGDGLPSPQELIRFRREARALARTPHPNIVPIYDVGEQDDLPYFTMELLSGGNLLNRLDGKPLDVHKAAELIETLARAVEAAHQAGVIHRDLKPSNVLLATDGTPKIGDFGLAKPLSGDSLVTPCDAILGTPCYAAPEQASGRGEPDARADIYSLGAILYECLTGQPPFKGLSTIDTLTKAHREPVTMPRVMRPDVPPILEAICLKCLEKTPDGRYATAAELADDLRCWQEGRPTRARPLSLWGRTKQRILRRPLIAAAVLGVLLLSAAAFGWIYSKDSSRHIRNYQSDLRRGKPVTLLGETGSPRWLEWSLSKGGSLRDSLQTDGYAIQSFNPSLAQLMPSPGIRSYRLSADVSHDEGTTMAEVGLFVGLRTARTEKGDGYFFCTWTFNDRVDASPMPIGNRPMLNFRLFSEHPVAAVDKMRSSRIGAGAGQTSFFDPIGPRVGNRIWRQLSIEVGPEGITPYWEGKASHTLDRKGIDRRLKDVFSAIGELANADPLFEPDAPLGLFVSAGIASFKNVVLTPR